MSRTCSASCSPDAFGFSDFIASVLSDLERSGSRAARRRTGATLEANPDGERQELSVGLRGGCTCKRCGRTGVDFRTPDVVIAELDIDARGFRRGDVHTAAEHHAEIRGAALADDVVNGHESARHAVVPPRA